MVLETEAFRTAVSWLRSAGRVVVFTGAGISRESGIPTFREEAGLWREFPPEQFASWKGLIHTARTKPGRLIDFLLAVLEPITLARPNSAHLAIGALEKHLSVTVVTQNVDGLHQEAGSTRVREVHGTFFALVNTRGRFLRRLARPELGQVVARLRRIRTGWFALPRLLLAISPLLGLSFRGIHRPRVVLFGDQLAEPDWTWAQRDTKGCPLMIVVGTSGLVLPAGLLPLQAKQQGARIIHVDPNDPGEGEVWLRGTAGEMLPLLVRSAFG
jgi:NAD-dependent deacetylase